jgi:hypothetical protein
MNQDPLLTVKWPQRLHSSVRSTYRSRVEVTQRLLLLDWECANAFLSCSPNTPRLQANKPWTILCRKSRVEGQTQTTGALAEASISAEMGSRGWPPLPFPMALPGSAFAEDHGDRHNTTHELIIGARPRASIGAPWDSGLVSAARSLSVRCRRQDFPPQLFGGRPGDESAVDDKFRTGDEARFVGGEKQRQLRDFVSVARASHWSKVDQGVH